MAKGVYHHVKISFHGILAFLNVLHFQFIAEGPTLKNIPEEPSYFRKIPRNVIMYFGILPFDSKSEKRCVLHESSWALWFFTWDKIIEALSNCIFFLSQYFFFLLFLAKVPSWYLTTAKRWQRWCQMQQSLTQKLQLSESWQYPHLNKVLTSLYLLSLSLDFHAPGKLNLTIGCS